MIEGDTGCLQQAIDPIGVNGIGNDDMRHASRGDNSGTITMADPGVFLAGSSGIETIAQFCEPTNPLSDLQF